jgi:hypothetical protein
MLPVSARLSERQFNILEGKGCMGSGEACSWNDLKASEVGN